MWAALGAVSLVAVIAIAAHPWRRAERPARSTLGASASSLPNAAPRSEPPSPSAPVVATTEMVTVVAVNPTTGQPTNGFQEVGAETEMKLTSCFTPSYMSLNSGVYDCTALGGHQISHDENCWPASTTSMLRLVNADPWAKLLRRFATDPVDFSPSTLTLDHPATPFALLLDDDTRCRFKLNWHIEAERDDGSYATYDCGAAGGVLRFPSDSDEIDRSKPLWKVKIGLWGGSCGDTFAPTSIPCAHFPPPQSRAVKMAFFTGAGPS